MKPLPCDSCGTIRSVADDAETVTCGSCTQWRVAAVSQDALVRAGTVDKGLLASRMGAVGFRRQRELATHLGLSEATISRAFADNVDAPHDLVVRWALDGHCPSRRCTRCAL